MGADTKGADSADWTVVGAAVPHRGSGGGMGAGGNNGGQRWSGGGGGEEVLQRSAGSPGGAGGGWGGRLLRGFGSKKKTLVKSSGRRVDGESGDVEPADSPQRRRHEDPHERPQLQDTARARQSSTDSMHHAPPNTLGGWKSVELLQHSCAILNRVGLELLMLDHLASQMVALPAAAGRGVGRRTATAETEQAAASQGQLALDPDVRTHFASAAIHVHGLLETLRGPVLRAHVLAAQSRNRATAVSASGRDVSGGGVDGVVRRIETAVEQLLRSWNGSYPPLLPAVDSLRGAGGAGGDGGSGGGGRAGAAAGGVRSAELVRRSASLEERPLAGGAAQSTVVAAQHGQLPNEEVVESTMRRVRDILTTRVEVAIASPFDGSTAASLDPWIDAWSRLYMLREHLDASIAACAREGSARRGEGVGERQP